jgi:hypothetical protein
LQREGWAFPLTEAFEIVGTVLTSVN